MRYLIVLPVLLAAIVFSVSGCCSNSCGSNACCNSHYQQNQSSGEQPNPPHAPAAAVSSELAQPEPIAAPMEEQQHNTDTVYTENVQPAVLPPAEPPMPSPETEVRSKPAAKIVPPNPPKNLVPPTNSIPNALPPTNELPTVLDSI